MGLSNWEYIVRRLARVFFLSIPTLISLALGSDLSWAQQPLSEEALIGKREDLCQRIHKRAESFSATRSILFAVRNKTHLYSVKETPIKTSESFVGEPANFRDLENIIFVFGSKDDAVMKMAYESIEREPEVQRILAELKKYEPLLKPLLKSTNENHCFALAQETRNPAEWTRFFELNAVADSWKSKYAETYENYVLGKRENAALKRIREKSRFNGSVFKPWRIVYSVTVNDLLQALQRPNIGNAVIVTHGNSSHYLVDSESNQIPLSVFDQISPSLLSLSIYTCNPDEILENYRLEGRISRQPKNHSLRYLYSVVPRPIAGRLEKVAIPDSLSGFVEDVEKSLLEAAPSIASKFAELSEVPNKDACSLSFRGITGQKISLMVSIGDKLIGVLAPGKFPDTVSWIPFPCEFLREKNFFGVEVLSYADPGNVVVQSPIASVRVGDKFLDVEMDPAPYRNPKTGQFMSYGFKAR